MNDEFPSDPYAWQRRDRPGDWPARGGPSANLPRRPPYSMSPSRPLPFPDRGGGPRGNPTRYGPLHPSSWAKAPVDLGKCGKAKNKTSYKACAARVAAAAAAANWDKCAHVGRSIQKQKGISKTKKKALKREQVGKCLRGGR